MNDDSVTDFRGNSYSNDDSKARGRNLVDMGLDSIAREFEHRR